MNHVHVRGGANSSTGKPSPNRRRVRAPEPAVCAVDNCDCEYKRVDTGHGWVLIWEGPSARAINELAEREEGATWPLP